MVINRTIEGTPERERWLEWQRNYNKNRKSNIRGSTERETWLEYQRRYNKTRIRKPSPLQDRNDPRSYRHRVFDHYGRVCVCCQEKEFAFLTIDHIEGGGTKHSREIRTTLYSWLCVNNFPEGFQVLCWNCNRAKWSEGICPHQKEIQRHGEQ